MTLGVGPAAWLKNSLAYRAMKLRELERLASKAYRSGYMAPASERLAITYAKAASCFEDELENLRAEETDPATPKPEET